MTRTATAVCCTLVALGFSACSSNDDGNPADGSTPSCRSYLAEGTADFNLESAVDTATVKYAYDAASNVLEGTAKGSSVDFAIKIEYPGKAAFIEEGQAVGLLRRTGFEVVGEFGYVYTYAQDKLTRRVKNGGEETVDYDSWDDKLRPTKGTVSIPGYCEGATTTIVYDDAKRTMEETWDVSAGTGTGCSSNMYFRLTYDVNNFEVVREEGQTGKVKTSYEQQTVVSTTEVCL